MARKLGSREPKRSRPAGGGDEWRRTFDAITDALCLVDLQGRIISCNKAFATFVGRTVEAAVGEDCCALIHDGPEHPAEWPLPKALETKAHHEAEYLLGDRWVWAAADPVLDETGALIGAVHSHAVIDARKRAESALRESEARFQLLAEVAPVGIFQTDEHGATVYTNRRWTEIAGLSADRALDRGWLQAVHPEDRDRVASGWGDAALAGRISHADFRFLRPDGTIAWVVGRAVAVVDASGRLCGYVGTISDISERKRAEDLQKAIYEISEATHQVENLHELFASVHSIVGRLMAARNLFIALYDPAADLVTFPYFVDEEDEPPEPRRPGAGLTEYILRTGEPLLATPEVFEDLVRRGEVRSIGTASIDWLGVPLVVGDRTLGVLAVQTYTKGVRYGEREKAILVFVSRQIALAIERSRAKEDLSRALAWQEEIVQGSRDAIFISDVDSRFTAVNRAASELTGYSRDELLTMRIGDLHEDVDLHAYNAFHDRILAGDDMVSSAQIRRKDGRKVEAEFNSRRILIEGVAHMHTVARDITGRKKAETALRESEERYRLLFHGVPIGVFHYDLDLCITDCNDRFVGILESTRDRLIGLDMSLLHDQSVLPAIRDALTDGHGEYDGPYHATTSTAAPFVSMRTASLRNGDGTVVGAVGIVEDITQRTRAEEALRESEQRYRSILQGIMEAYYEVDLTGTMTFCNDAMMELLGYTHEEIIGLNNRAYMDAATGKRVYQTYKRVYETSEPIRSVGFEYLRKDGTPVAVELSVSLMSDVDGRPVGFRGIVRDVTDRKRLEEQLVESQKMEVVGTLAGGVAHDFNNLLQAMLSHAQLLRRLSHDPEKWAAVVRELEQQIQRGASLTRQLLLFSRRETAKPERVDINDAVRDAAQILERLVRANIALVIEPALERLLVDADRGQLQQVLMNLTLNASDAIPDRGQIVIRTGAVGLDEAWLSVEDSGRGIPEAIRERIFEPFFTTKDRGRGTGLGLSVVHGIVTRNGGRIEVESAVGKGSTFKVFLSRAGSGELSPREEAPATEPTLALGRGERVLIVEDEDGARESLRDILAFLGYDVAAVGSGEEAVKLPEARPFDLLLTDLMLPGAAGPQVAAELRQRWPALAVILMSGYTEDDVVRRGVTAGDVRFLQKPFDMDTLTREVRAALDERPDPDGA